MLPFPPRIRSVNTLYKLVKCWDGSINSTRASSSLSYCINLVRKYDYENFLCTILLPNDLKATAFALRAFNIELSLIQKQVTEKGIMPIRFKFWEERLDDVYNKKTVNHPVVIELSNAVNRHKLQKGFLKMMSRAREKQCDCTTFHSMNDMQDYAHETNSPVYMLLLEASGVKHIDCDHVASHLGIAQGLTNLLRALPYNLKDKIILLPTSLLLKYNVSEEDLFRLEPEDEELRDIVYDVAKVANDHMNKVQSMEDRIPPQCRVIFLPAVAVGKYLKNLEKSDFDLFNKRVYNRNALLPLSLYYNKVMKTF